MTRRQKTGGRQQGTPNKISTEIKEKFDILLNKNLENLQADIDKLTPYRRVELLLSMAKFIIPTLRAQEVDITNTTDNFRIVTLNIPDIGTRSTKNITFKKPNTTRNEE